MAGGDSVIKTGTAKTPATENIEKPQLTMNKATNTDFEVPSVKEHLDLSCFMTDLGNGTFRADRRIYPFKYRIKKFYVGL